MTHTMTIRLPDDIHDRLRQKCYTSGQAMNQIVTDALWEHLPTSLLNRVELEVWRAWNLIDQNDPSPVKRIAADLGMQPADVAFIVYPVEQFGRWDDDQEPDLPA